MQASTHALSTRSLNASKSPTSYIFHPNNRISHLLSIAISLGGYNPTYLIMNLISIVFSTLVAVIVFREAPGLRNKLIVTAAVLLMGLGVFLLSDASSDS